jgi:transcriptional regulator with XRE-family HTH domain
MSDMPFRAFGEHLKDIRKKAKESIAELSNAVEVDTLDLKKIEAGKTQPTEDVLILLISHFSLKDEDAIKMWELAGYGQNISMNTEEKKSSQIAYISQEDAKIIYTDIVHVNANRYGVVINFLQGLGVNNQPVAVSRIGMSHEHARSLIEVLQKTMKMSEDQSTKDTKKSK